MMFINVISEDIFIKPFEVMQILLKATFHYGNIFIYSDCKRYSKRSKFQKGMPKMEKLVSNIFHTKIIIENMMCNVYN